MDLRPSENPRRTHSRDHKLTNRSSSEATRCGFFACFSSSSSLVPRARNARLASTTPASAPQPRSRAQRQAVGCCRHQSSSHLGGGRGAGLAHSEPRMASALEARATAKAVSPPCRGAHLLVAQMRVSSSATPAACVHMQSGADRRLDVDAARDRNARAAIVRSLRPTWRPPAASPALAPRANRSSRSPSSRRPAA